MLYQVYMVKCNYGRVFVLSVVTVPLVCTRLETVIKTHSTLSLDNHPLNI
jgi:hypothetical protein